MIFSTAPLSSPLLPATVVHDLALRFMIATDDTVKQNCVDDLGLDPRNHARFMEWLISQTADGSVARSYAVGDYYRMTAWMGAK